MLLGIDHMVIAVADPEAAALALQESLGLVATSGGRHEAGTWNRLVFLGDAYLELIGVWDAARAAEHPIGAAALAILAGPGAGLAAIALGTDGIRREAAALHSAGSPISMPDAGSRIRPDGGRVAWQTATAPPLGPDRPPFLIEHELDGPEWGSAARASRARFVHPFGGTARLIGIELSVAVPAVSAAAWESTVGVSFVAAPAAEPEAVEARIGDHRVRLVTAASDPLAPPARVGIMGSAGARVLIDLLGVRFARL